MQSTPARWPALPARVAALREIARQFDDEEGHAAQVTRLSLMLFDQLRAQHGLGDHARQLLSAAGVLHDIGWYLGMSKHNKSSRKLIEGADLPGFTDGERAIIALLARYHRGALPRARHRRFSGLKKADRDLVCKLAAILRVADGLDRMHCDVVQDLRVCSEGEGFRLTVAVTGEASSELWAARKKSDLFEQEFGPLHIEVAPATGC